VPSKRLSTEGLASSSGFPFHSFGRVHEGAKAGIALGPRVGIVSKGLRGRGGMIGKERGAYRNLDQIR